MNTNAEKISEWRHANHYDTLNGPLLRKLLSLTTLRGANLSCAPLRNADLWDANLRGADLTDANLADSNHWGGMPISTPSGYLSHADAVLAALATPTPAMVEAGAEALFEESQGLDQDNSWDDPLPDEWRAAWHEAAEAVITAALTAAFKEGKA